MLCASYRTPSWLLRGSMIRIDRVVWRERKPMLLHSLRRGGGWTPLSNPPQVDECPLVTRVGRIAQAFNSLTVGGPAVGGHVTAPVDIETTRRAQGHHYEHRSIVPSHCLEIFAKNIPWRKKQNPSRLNRSTSYYHICSSSQRSSHQFATLDEPIKLLSPLGFLSEQNYGVRRFCSVARRFQKALPKYIL